MQFYWLPRPNACFFFCFWMKSGFQFLVLRFQRLSFLLLNHLCGKVFSSRTTLAPETICNGVVLTAALNPFQYLCNIALEIPVDSRIKVVTGIPIDWLSNCSGFYFAFNASFVWFTCVRYYDFSIQVLF